MASEVAGIPIYRQVKESILAKIDSGDWPAGHRVPSENELVRRTGASRMTINRALRELADEGRIRRVQGAGSFVTEPKSESDLMVLQSIADEIDNRGRRHESVLHALDSVSLDPETAAKMGLKPTATAFRSIMVHREDGHPLQIEERLVNPALAPRYLEADFTRETPNAYLTRHARAGAVEHVVEAAEADTQTARLLGIRRGATCLVAHRRTWVGRDVASIARLTHPAERYRLTAGAPPQGVTVANL